MAENKILNNDTVSIVGDLGVGTTSPAQKLEVSFAASVYGARFTRNDAAGSSLIEFANNAGVKSIIGYDAGVDGYRIGTPTANNLTVKQSGNVGIGTTSPNYKLDVYGSARIGGVNGNAELIIEADADNSGENDNPRLILKQDGGLVNGTIGLNGDANNAFTGALSNGMYISAYDALQLRGGSGGIVTVDGNGNVGIGTTSPAKKLDVNGVIRISNGGSDKKIEFLRTGGKTFSIEQDTSRLYFYNSTDGISSLAIRNNGNVGIGTQSPSKKLDIVASDSDGVKVSGGTNGRYVEVTSSNLDFYTTSVSGYGMSNLVRKNSDGSVLGQISGAYGGDPNILTYTYYGGTAYNNAAMYILSSNKNVGIGTTSPAYKLHVNGNGLFNGGLTVGDSSADTFRSNGTTQLAVLGNNVLIGTTTDNGSKLQVNGYVRSSNSISEGIAYAGTGFEHWGDGGTGVNFPSNDVVTLRTASTDRLYINSSGNVGIGTTNPSYPLEVAGTSTVSLAYQRTGVAAKKWGFHSDNSNTYWQNLTDNILAFTLSNAGNVGIGTTTPDFKLDVAGDIGIDDKIYHNGDHNTYISLTGDAQTFRTGGTDRVTIDNTRVTMSSPLRIDTTGTALEITGTTTVDSSDVSIYLGNSPSAYGFYITYVGTGGGNTNALRIQSTNAGTPKTLLISNQDGIVNFPTGLQLNGAGVATQSWVSSQSYATQSYVNTAVSNLVDSAPSTLDTLNELAAALGDDPNFATTVTNSIATKLPLAGGTMTGTLKLNSELQFFRGGSSDYSNYIRANNYPSEGYTTSTAKYWLEYGAKGGHHFVVNTDGGSGAALNDYDDFTIWQGAIDGDRLFEVRNNGDVQIPSGSLTVSGTVTGSNLNVSNWNTAYSWGNHSGQYLPINGGTVGGPVTINGSLVVNGTITENSSLRVKENIITSEGHLERVNKLRPVKYNKIDSDKTEIGLIAEEVEEVYPEFIQYDENGDPVGIHYSRLTASLIGAVKELTKEVEELKNKING